ncbi:MAG: LbtU family siderophore porin [Pseudomonadota bacterium]
MSETKMKTIQYTAIPWVIAAMFACSGQALGVDAPTISGLVEVEVNRAKDFAGDKSGAVALATVELAFDVKINDAVTANALLLHEDGENFVLDQGTITLETGTIPGRFVAGRFFVPFGAFESNLISDPLTLELGETQEAAIQWGMEAGGFYGSVYAFNGDTSENGDDGVFEYGANLGYTTDNLTVGIGYISSIGESNTLTDHLVTTALAEYVAGAAAHAVCNLGPVTAIGEYITALDRFAPGELDSGSILGAEPNAYNLEIDYTFDMKGAESTVALAYQGTEEALGLGLPESRILLGLGMGIYENTRLSFEYARDADYDTDVGGTGENGSNFTAQLAVSF